MTTESDVITAWREATPPDAPLAARFFAADMEQMRLHSDVFDLLQAVFGEDAVDDFSADYYDRSVEVFLTDRPTSLPDITPLRDAGFHLLWVHSVSKGCVPPRGECKCAAIAMRRRDGR